MNFSAIDISILIASNAIREPSMTYVDSTPPLLVISAIFSSFTRQNLKFWFQLHHCLDQVSNSCVLLLEKHFIHQHILKPYIDALQDGHFVPNLTLGAPVIESLRKHTKAYLDCHLMVTNPLDYVEPLGKAGASGFTFHVEASRDNWQELVQRIKSKGMKPGVSLKPGTPIEEVYPLLDGENSVELVLVMTVEPGFGGQKFMPEMMDKVRTLRKKYPSLDIEVDGGLGPSTIEAASSAGANCIVAGSSVFGAPDPAQVITLMRGSVEKRS
ncbi:Ribulose-phosphate 3-epimerase [Capsicum annuum]|nr:Ribulose-phosphate 3-epimerase [Capsicum annuum]